MSRRIALLVSLLFLVVAVTWWRSGDDTPAPNARSRFRPTVKALSAQPKRDRPPPRNLDAGAPSSSGSMARPGAHDAREMGGRPEKMHAPYLDPARPRAMNPGPEVAPDAGEAADDGAGDEVEQAELEETIRTALEDPEPTNRAAAISNLGLSDDFAPVVPVLQRAAADPDPDVKLAVLEAMGNMGADVPQNLVEQYAKDSDPDIRLEALTLAEQLLQEDRVPPYVEPLLRSAASDPNEEVSDKAKEILEDGWPSE